MDVIVCETKCVHHDLVDDVLSKMPNGKNLDKVSELFKVFGDLTRTKILAALFEQHNPLNLTIFFITTPTHIHVLKPFYKS